MFSKRTKACIAGVLAGLTLAFTGCLTAPRDGQNIGMSFMPFQAKGYFPNIQQTKPYVVLQAFNYWNGQWEYVAPVTFTGAPRYKDGNWYYPWKNDFVLISHDKYWQKDAGTGLWRARFRAFDLANGVSLPPTDDATLAPNSNLDYVRLYAYL